MSPGKRGPSSPKRGLGPSDGLLAGDAFGPAEPEAPLSLGERLGAALSWSLGGAVIRRCARERLRPLPAVIWLGGALLVAGLAFSEVFFVLRTHGLASAEVAARSAFRTVFVIQALVLLLLGTGSVASGLARERETGVLDYLRLSPLHPRSKILGALWGLPIREYAMVAVTLPLSVAAAWLAHLPAANVIGLYGALLTSAWLYHATGLVAGMVATRPRRAGWTARFLILALYLFFPRLAEAGLTFLGYVTVLPAFDALVSSSLGYYATSPTGWSGVGFFSVTLSPAVYTLLVQGWLLAALLYVVRRKWQHTGRSGVSKPGGLLLFASLQLLMVGSLWPSLVAPHFRAVQAWGLGGVPPEVFWGVALYGFFGVTGAGLLVVLGAGTPGPVAERRGLRRAQRQGRAQAASASQAPGLLEPGRASPEPGASRDPASASQEPAGASKAPAGASQEPAGASQEPAGASQEPAGASRAPASASRKPGTTRELDLVASAIASQEQGAAQEPGRAGSAIASREPGTARKPVRAGSAVASRNPVRARLAWSEDDAPGLLWTLGIVSLGAAGYLALLALAEPSGGLAWDASAGRHLVQILLLCGVALQIHAATLAGGRGGLLALVGLGWILPPVLGVLLASAFGAYATGAYVAAASPPGAFAAALLALFWPGLATLPSLAPLGQHLPGLVTTALLALLGPAGAAELWLWRRRRAWSRQIQGS